VARRLRARPRDLGARDVAPRPPLVFGVGASLVAAVWSARGVSEPFVPLTVAPFVISAICFAAAALLPRGERATFIALAAAAPLAGWSVALGYGSLGVVLRGAAIVATACALTGIASLPRVSRLLVATTIAVAAAILVTLAIAPYALPIAGVWIYGVMALCGAFLAVSVTHRGPSALRVIASIVGWLVAAGLVLLVYRVPLAGS
jgi:hypothetical protein